MASSLPTLGDVLNELLDYVHVAFRIALRKNKPNRWSLHTLVIDAIPDAYLLARLR